METTSPNAIPSTSLVPSQFLKGQCSPYHCCLNAPCSGADDIPAGEVALLRIAAQHTRVALASSELIVGIWGSRVAVLAARELGSSLICRGVQVVKTAPVLTSVGPLRAGEMLCGEHWVQKPLCATLAD